MAPRAKRNVKASPSTTGRRLTVKETPGRSAPSRTTPGRRRIDKSRGKGRKGKQKLKLKGWLATPADWAHFNAWAKINAQPKKIAEPEPIVRPSKPLSQLRQKMKILAQPRKAPDPSVNCRLDHGISKAALNAVPSRRTILLALPNIKLCDFGRVYYKISPSALKYQPSQRIIDLSQPRVLLPEECKPPRVSMCERRGLDEERLRKLALAKKLLDCPQQLTKEEIEELFTPSGIKRTALAYKITPWMEFLALPPYKKIKERKDEDAVCWKKKIIEEGEERGKSALAEYRKKEEEERMARKRKCKDEGEEEEDGDEEEEEEKDEKARQMAKRRKIEKHAWRFAPHPCKDDPNRIKRAALEDKASSRMVELAKPRTHKSRAIRTDAFSVRKGALSATASGRVADLAKPPKPRSPVERRQPRQKDEYGRPIFEMPVYGKVLPKTKPYKMGECPPAEKKKKKKVAKKHPIDPIAFESTYDPCINPDMAKRQKMERKRAEKLLSKKKGKRKKRKKSSKKLGDKKPEKAEETKDESENGETWEEAREELDEPQEELDEPQEEQQQQQEEEPQEE